jgi:hypothetical protein
MRVDVVETLPEQDQAAVRAFSDAAVDRALKSFRAALESDDSLFAAETGGVLLIDNSNENVCLGTITLTFRDHKLAANRGAHFGLLEKVSELLRQAGSAESLKAVLAISPARLETKGLAIAMRLEAKGNSPEQAGLRWGLGLAHVQQAFLFTSRSLRQQFAGGN